MVKKGRQTKFSGGALENEKKMRAEAFWRHAQDATERLERRRSYEWKMNIALWTPFGAATGWILAKNQTFDQNLAHWSVGVVVILVLMYIFLWEWTIQKIHFQDRQKSVYWKNRYLKELGVVSKELACEQLFPYWAKGKDGKILGLDFETIDTEKKGKVVKRWPRLWWYNKSFFYQVLVAVILAGALCFSIVRSVRDSPKIPEGGLVERLDRLQQDLKDLQVDLEKVQEKLSD
jgi:hypothetical protein